MNDWCNPLVFSCSLLLGGFLIYCFSKAYRTLCWMRHELTLMREFLDRQYTWTTDMQENNNATLRLLKKVVEFQSKP